MGILFTNNFTMIHTSVTFSTEMAYNTIGLSAEAYKLLRDTGGFHSFYDDTSSSLIIPAKKPEMLAFKTVKEGMDQIPQKLILEFLNSSTGYSNR